MVNSRINFKIIRIFNHNSSSHYNLRIKIILITKMSIIINKCKQTLKEIIIFHNKKREKKKKFSNLIKIN